MPFQSTTAMEMSNSVYEVFRRRLSFSPSSTPSRTPTPAPVMRPEPGSTSSRLSKEDIDEILESPFETNYTYSDSAAYKPHIGPREYIHPRLCRRFPATPPPVVKEPSRPVWVGWRWESWTQLLVYILQITSLFMVTATQYVLQQAYYVVRYLLIRAAWYTLRFTILAPILTPYYAAKSYYNKARFVWRTTRNLWTFLSWTWAWWTGQPWQEPPAPTMGVQTRAMSRADVERTKDHRHQLALWLFLYLPLLLLLLWAGYHFYGGGGKKEPIEVQQIHGKPEKKLLKKTQPSDELRDPHLAHPGTPKSDFPQPSVHLPHFKSDIHPPPAPADNESPPISEIPSPGPGFFRFSGALTHFIEQLSIAGQTIGQAIANFFIGAYEWLKSVLFFIVTLPIKFANVLARVGRAIISTVWASLKWVAESIAALLYSPFKSTTQWSGNVWNSTKLVASKGAEQFKHLASKTKDALNWFFSSVWHSLEWLFDAILRSLRWIVFQCIRTMYLFWDLLGRFGEKLIDGILWTKDKIIDGIVWTKNGIVNGIIWMKDRIVDGIFWAKSKAGIFGKFIVDKSGSFGSFMGHVLWWPVEKVIDGIIWTKNRIIDGFLWAKLKAEMFGKFIMEKTGNVAPLMGRVLWWPIEKVSVLFITLFRSIVYTFASIYYATVSFFMNTWNSAREFQLIPPKPPRKDMGPEQPDQPTIEHLLSPSAELGDLPDDHPLIQHFHRILMAALADERRSTEQRLRRWAEHNTVLTQSQLDKLAPKLVESAKEQVETDLSNQKMVQQQQQPSIGGSELKGMVQEELNRKMRMEKEELSRTVNNFEEQITMKIRLLIEQFRSQNANLEHKLDELVGKQAEMEKNVQGEQLTKQEKITYQKEGQKEVTKESTFTLRKQFEQFDERELLRKVRNLIRTELRRFDADRTGIPDYALESSGGSVLSTRCTVQYNERSRTQKLFGIPLWYSSYSPRSVIQRKGYGASAGECWAYYGGHGFLTIGLSKHINVTAVSYEHLPVELSPDGHIRTAPRNFLVWSYQEVDNMGTRQLLGNFTYNANGEPLQMFPVQQWDPRGTQIIELETLTNWGAPVTCLYRFRVHGDMQRVIPEVTDDEFASLELESKHLSSAGRKTLKSVVEDHDLL